MAGRAEQEFLEPGGGDLELVDGGGRRSAGSVTHGAPQAEPEEFEFVAAAATVPAVTRRPRPPAQIRVWSWPSTSTICNSRSEPSASSSSRPTRPGCRRLINAQQTASVLGCQSVRSHNKRERAPCTRSAELSIPVPREQR
jgi:hypothetical protein